MTVCDIIQAEQCDSATGCKQRMPLGGQLYDNDGERISDAKARKLFREGYCIEAPNAGAGSYKYILARLGFKNVKVEDWTSSAGDWCFKIKTGYVFQENRYPYYGFAYKFQTFEDSIYR